MASFGQTADAGHAFEPIISTGTLYFEERESVIVDQWKYVRSIASQREELYDRGRDHSELRSLAHAAPAELHRGRELLAAHHQQADEAVERYGGDRAERRLDSQTEDRLRSLGYVD